MSTNGYRATSGINKESLSTFFDGDGAFGRGMYFTLTDEDADSYLDRDAPPCYVSRYRIDGEVLTISNKDENCGIFNSAEGIDFARLGFTGSLASIRLSRADELGEAVLAAGYDAVILMGLVCGGEQILVPTGSKAKISLVEIYED